MALAYSFDICPCCFVEYGYDDSWISQQEWISKGGPWNAEYLKPANWNMHEQLTNAIEGWHGGICGYARAHDYENKFGPEIERFVAWCTDPDPRRRLTAIIVLGWLEDERVEPALTLALSDSDEDVRDWAKHALEGRKEARNDGLR